MSEQGPEGEGEPEQKPEQEPTQKQTPRRTGYLQRLRTIRDQPGWLESLILALACTSLLATAAAAAGVPLPSDRPIDGVDLVPYVLGEQEGAPHDALFWRTGPYEVVRAGDWKLQTSVQAPDGSTRTWLFDLANDPTERNDLSAQNPGKVTELRALIARHNEQQVPPAWPSLGQNPINIDKTLLEADAPDDEFIYWAN